MLGNLGQIAATVSLNIDPFQVSQRVLNSSIKATAAELRAQDAAFKGSEKSINNMRSTYDTLSRQSKNYQAQLQKQREQYDENSKAVEKLNKSETASQEEINRATKLQANAASQYNRTAAAAAQNENRMAALRKEIALQSDGWTKVSNGASKFASVTEKASSKLTSFGSTMTKAVTAPIAIGFVAAAKSAIDFNSQIQAMGPLLTNGGAITAKYRAQLDQLASASKKWSVEYGVSTAAINDGMSEMIKRGYTAAQTLGAMPAVLNAAKASGDDFNDVMHVSTSVLEQFGLKTESTTGMLKNTSRVTDALTYIANATAAGFQDMGEAMTYVGPSAHAAGISLEETAAAIGIMSNKGIEGSVAGTALRGALTRLLKPSKQNLQGFNELGISVADFKKGTLTLPEILDKIKNNTKGWTDQQRASAVALAFGTEAQAGMNALIGAGGGELRKYTSEAEHASGTTAKIANQLNNTDAAKLKRFQESIHVLGIEVGQKLLPTLTPLIKTATDVVNAFTKMDSGTQQTIIKFAAFAAVVGPVSSLIGGALKPVTALSKGISGIAGVIGRASAAAKLGGTAMDVLESGFSKTAFQALKVAPAAAAAAEGTSGMGAAMGGAAASGTGLLAALGPIVPVVLGVTAVVGAGVAIWELWGKKALESADRTSRWGTDIGADADRSASKMKDASGAISGAFDDTNHTVTQNAKTIANSFDDITKAAKESSKNTQTALDKLAKQVGGSTADQIRKDAAEMKKADDARIKQIEANAKQAKSITESASKEHAEFTRDQIQILDNLRKSSAAEAVKTLRISGTQQANVLKAINGEKIRMSQAAAKEQYSQMQQAFADETDTYGKHYAAIKNSAELSTAQKNKDLEKLEKDHQSNMSVIYAGAIQAMKAQGLSNKTIQQQLQTEFGATASQAKKAMNAYSDAMSKGVKDTKQFAAAVSDGMSKNVKKAGNDWNKLVLDPKTGKVITNLPEVLHDTANTKEGWKRLTFDLKNAKISTNAKETIAIALASTDKWNSLSVDEKNAIIKETGRKDLADLMKRMVSWNDLTLEQQQAVVKGDYAPLVDAIIQAGTWNQLDVEDKQVLVKDKANIPLVDALVNSGRWNKLDLKTQNALLQAKGKKDLEDVLFNMGLWNSLDMNEKYAQLKAIGKTDLADMIDQLGLWDTITPKQMEAAVKGDYSQLTAAIDQVHGWNQLDTKQLEAIVQDKATVPLIQAMIQNQKWNGLSVEEKNAILKTKGMPELADMVVKYGSFDSLPDSTKRLLINDDDARQKLIAAGVNMDKYNVDVNPDAKILKGDSNPLLAETIKAKEVIADYATVLPDKKQFGGNSSGVTNAAKSGEGSIGHYDTVLPGLKLFIGDSSSVTNHAEKGKGEVNSFNGTNPSMRYFMGNASSVVGAAGSGKNSVGSFNGTNPGDKYFKGHDNTTGPASAAKRAVSAFGGNEVITKTFNFVANISDSIRKLLHLQHGTNDLRTSSLAMVNDASGSNYQEPIITPNGNMFMFKERNVVFPLARHSMVIPADKARRMNIPRFAGGTTDFGGAANRINQLNPQTFVTSISSGSNSRVEDLLARLIELTTYQISNPSVPEGKVVLDNGREVGRWLYPTINKLKNRDTIMSNRRRGIF
ncbi:phage tail tape measure protein [Lacticaseibacillus paracasei]|uniref:phage tail tape measure protein n=1 Tax=Lacticaseibacillus paracasei TaxID=1597 RepID=UPI0022236E1F|nr:phage tail tape measure protein [Lacticaseibacillus paracasei]UYX01582.1 phage tail tape measure protein [Lacticaseibacillus paracasei subsp. tolerans]UYX01638.1 phage tail tape measure protein [Lacticaseibacillus paracasei subsp. tolerans]UYX04622.1 phage tail tape measure protein [Lacticaseibacillus paracasei subsp. tolerans]